MCCMHSSPPGAVWARTRCGRILGLLVLCATLTSSRGVWAASLSGSFEVLYSGTNSLTAEGTLDWSYWGLVTEFSYCHKYGVAQQIKYSFTTDWADYPRWDGPYIVDYRWGGNYDFCWTDGTPARVVEDAWNGVSIYGDRLQPDNVPTGFHIECAASTSPRTLRLYLGNSWGKANVVARLSGAPTYTDLWLDGHEGLNRVYILEFQADSPGQTLSVDFTCTDPTWYITLQAASLAGTNSPPAVAITAPADGARLSAPATFSLISTATDNDGVVTNLSLFRAGTLLGQSASGAFTLGLTNQPAGGYDFFAVATDNSGLSITSFPVRVNVTANGGTLVGSVDTPPAFVDLSAEGTNDWAHWGLGSPGSFNHKSGVVEQVPNVVLLNASAAQLLDYSDNLTAFSWSDGTPTLKTVDSASGVFLYTTNESAVGFQLAVPAADFPRQLKVYVGLSYAQGRMEAWLDDFSAMPFSDSSLVEPDNNGYAVYTFTYAATHPGAKLIVRWTSADFFNPLYANVTWQAVSLSELPGPRPPPVLRILRPSSGSNQIALAFDARTGANYTVQWVDSLGSTNWQSLTNLVGAGREVMVTDPGMGPGRRFYRVLAQ